MRTGIRALLLVAVAVTLAPATVHGNMANPSDPGDVVGEPSAALAQLAIEHEKLAIDLRPLADAKPAVVEATYEVRNDGAERAIALVFVAPSITDSPAGSLRDNAAVTLDGVPVQFVGADGETADWPPPSTTPTLSGGRQLPYYATNRGQLLFSLDMTPGRHVIAVRYAADPSRYSGDSPTVYWQLGYVLAPARRWASFGTLEVAVQVPAGWNAASDPPLERIGDELRGTFNGVPADALALTARMPPPTSWSISWPLIVLATVLIGGIVGWVGGRALGRRGRGGLWLLPLAVFYGLGAMVMTAVVGLADDGGRGGIPSTQVAWTYGYGSWAVSLLLAPVAGVVAGTVLQVAGLVAAAGTRRRGQASTGMPATR